MLTALVRLNEPSRRGTFIVFHKNGGKPLHHQLTDPALQVVSADMRLNVVRSQHPAHNVRLSDITRVINFDHSPDDSLRPYCWNVASTLAQQAAQIDYGGVGACNIVRHDQRVVGKNAEATAVQNHGAEC